MHSGWIALGAFLFGLLIGSFLNVCIYRLPKDESVVRPRSRCPHCGQTIRWHDNIPLLSFLLLGGRCRHCGAAISFLYPTVEMLTGLLFAVLFWRFGPSLGGIKFAIFVSMMLVLAFADLTDRLLPDEITLGGAAAGFLFSIVSPLPPGAASLGLTLFDVRLSGRAASMMESALGSLAAAGLLWAVAEIYYRIRFREGMGLGDVKMMLAIGAFLGLRGAILAIMTASVMGAVLGMIFILLFRKGMAYELPFGTFLAFASILLVILPNDSLLP